MGVYVTDMEMPTDCRECPMCTYYTHIGRTMCRVTNEVLADDYAIIPFKGRSAMCPLIDVATPHGALIDEDTLVDTETLYPVNLKGCEYQVVIPQEE